jgi:aspartate carbamoyltransferase regulatory subunit
LCVAREKVINLSLYVNFTFRCDNYNCISKHTSPIVGSLSHEQCSKWVPKSSMVWPHWHCERSKTTRCDITKRIWSVIRKWVEINKIKGC